MNLLSFQQILLCNFLLSFRQKILWIWFYHIITAALKKSGYLRTPKCKYYILSHGTNRVHVLEGTRTCYNRNVESYKKFKECCGIKILAHLVLCDLFLQDFTFTQLENLHNLSNLRENCWLNAIWHRQSVAALIFCKKLPESDIIITP